MAESLTEYLKELEATEPATFSSPQIRYGAPEDSLLLYFRNDESYAHRLDQHVTLFLSFVGDELVGCQVKGLKHKLTSSGTFSVAIQREGKLELGLFFHLLAYEATEQESRDRLVELGQRAKGLEMDTKILAIAV